MIISTQQPKNTDDEWYCSMINKECTTRTDARSFSSSSSDNDDHNDNNIKDSSSLKYKNSWIGRPKAWKNNYTYYTQCRYNGIIYSINDYVILKKGYKPPNQTSSSENLLNICQIISMYHFNPNQKKKKKKNKTIKTLSFSTNKQQDKDQDDDDDKEDNPNIQMMECRWFYTPETTWYGRNEYDLSQELFLSENHIKLAIPEIKCKCIVYNLSQWYEKGYHDDNMLDYTIKHHIYFIRKLYMSSTGQYKPLINSNDLLLNNNNNNIQVKEEELNKKKDHSSSSLNIFRLACNQLQLCFTI